MSDEAMKNFITEFIAARRQQKLEAFDKEAAKQLASDAKKHEEIAQQRLVLQQRYQPQAWLTDAAARAGQIKLVTHAAKFTHGDSRSSSLYSETQHHDGFCGSASLADLTLDAVGNAAALDVAKFLQTEVGGDSLLACLQRNDDKALRAFAENEQQLKEWIEGFSQALAPGVPASHKLAKQIYFPVGESYHLLSPLFATSFAHQLHQKLIAQRFGDSVKAAWQARKEGKWHAEPVISYPDMAEMHFGGTKPQNISYLKSVRGGRIWLLSAQPPVWEKPEKPPVNMRSIFASRSAFNRNVSSVVNRITQLIERSKTYNNVHIRDARDEYIDEIIDRLMVLAGGLQSEEWQGWTINCPNLVAHQQLWLDPWRAQIDEQFRQEREKGDWQKSVAEDFARWFNMRLSAHIRDLGETERREWQTRPRLQMYLREMEHIIREGMK